MTLFVIFGQRKNSYPGEHAPEAIEVTDEFSNDENPLWLQDKLAAHKSNTSFEKVEIIQIKVSEHEITRILFPPSVIKGEVKNV